MYGPRRFSLFPVLTLLLALSSGGAWADHTGNGDLENGEEVYNGTCVACHGETGKGEIDGVPDFTKSDGRLTKDDHTLLHNMTEGFRSAGSYFEMPALGGDEDLMETDVIDVLMYLRQVFGRR